MQDQIVTADVYESCFYILRGCTLVVVQGIPVNGKINCQLKFTGDNILKIQAEYFSGKASVNLFEFRRTWTKKSSTQYINISHTFFAFYNSFKSLLIQT